MPGMMMLIERKLQNEYHFWAQSQNINDASIKCVDSFEVLRVNVGIGE